MLALSGDATSVVISPKFEMIGPDLVKLQFLLRAKSEELTPSRFVGSPGIEILDLTFERIEKCFRRFLPLVV